LGTAIPAAALLFLSLWLTYRTLNLPPRVFRFGVTRRWHYRLLTLAPWALFTWFAISLLKLLAPDAYFKGFFYSYRSIEIGSGVSPVLPLLFVFMGFACWSVIQLQRRVFSEERYQLLPDLTTDQIVSGLSDLVKKLEEYIEATFPLPFVATSVASLILFFAAYFITSHSFQSLEGPVYDNFYSAAIAALTTLVFLCTWRFWRCWKILQLFLEQLALHPIRDAIEALPAEDSFSWSPIWQASPRKYSYALYSRAVECLRELRIVLGSPISTSEEPLSNVRELMGFVSRRTREGFELQVRLQLALQDTAQDTVYQLNQVEWIKGSSQTWKDQQVARKGAIPLPNDDNAEPGDERFAILAKEFVALRFVAFIRYVMLQLRNLLTFIMLGFVLLALSLGSYPFGSPQLLAWTLIGCLATTGTPMIWAFLEMERDTILSFMNNTKAGEVGKSSFLLRVTSFGILPLLSVLASHFPSIGQYLFSWVQPVIKSVH
jgi:hypothetical protein